MMGLVLDFSEKVIRYVPGREKVWRTLGTPQLLILDSYEMRVAVEPVSEAAARLTIGIDYELPRSGLWRLIGRALAAPYARWCVQSMIDGTKRDIEQGAG